MSESEGSSRRVVVKGAVATPSIDVVVVIAEAVAMVMAEVVAEAVTEVAAEAVAMEWCRKCK